MRHLRDIEEAKLSSDALVGIGVFDGLHIGHQQLIRRLVRSARAAQRLALVLTFFPHPDKLLHTAPQRYYLTTLEKRVDLLLGLGLDMVITQAFDERIRRLPAADFVELLLTRLRMKELWVGADFALGFQREGDIAFLRAAGEQHGFTVRAVELLAGKNSGGLVSSSEIRDLLRQGQVGAAKELLGRAYSLEGEVIAGQQRGRSIGVPTANLAVWAEQIIPAKGVYAAWARLGDELFRAAVNIGQRPTFAGSALTIEAHLLDFDRDIYGQGLELQFERRLRPEQKFDSLPALVAQIQADIATTRRLLSGA